MEDVISKELNNLKLYGMANSWQSIKETIRTESVSLESALELMLQAEKDYRSSRKTSNLIKKAKFRYQATIGEIYFDKTKGKDRDRIMQLASCEYIEKGISVLITGPSGVGKSYLSAALGLQACINGYKVRYYNMNKLMDDIHMARVESSIVKFFEKMTDYDLIIIEDFGLHVLNNQQLLDFMELMEDRHGTRSMIITSQLPKDQWYDVLSANTMIADAIVDRLKVSYQFSLSGASLRGKDKKL